MKHNRNKMNDDEDLKEIARFLGRALPMILTVVKCHFVAAGLEASLESRGMDLAFSITSGEKEAKFFLQNLLLEIATIDRDERPLRLDERLNDPEYILDKVIQVTDSKLRILIHLFNEDDVDAALENIAEEGKHYERLRILKVDQEKQE